MHGRGSSRSRALVVAEVTKQTDKVVTVRLVDPGGAHLDLWAPGDHVHCTLPSGRVRPFSLCGDPADRASYEIAVQRNDDGGGATIEMHALDFLGSVVEASGPFNAFALVSAPGYLFVAESIGIAPLRPMMHEASAAGRPWDLVYFGRGDDEMAFVSELRALRGGRVSVNVAGAPSVDILGRALSGRPAGHLVYCCGSGALVGSVEALCEDLDSSEILHTEACQRLESVGAVAGLRT